jgi:hypothetical protein
MATFRRLTQIKWRLALLIGMVGIAGIGIGIMLPATAPANPSVRRTAPPEAFKSGSQLSVPVLREMAQTLQRIDDRLQRIEQAVLKAAAGEQPSRTTRSERR